MAYNRPFMQNQMNFNPANQQGSLPSLMHHNNNVNVPFMMNNSFNPNTPTPSGQHMPYQNFPNAPSPCVPMMNRMQFGGHPSNPMYGPPRIPDYSNPPIRNQTPNFDMNLHLQHRGMMMYHPRNHQMLQRPPPNIPNEFRKLDFVQQGNQPNTYPSNIGQPRQAIEGAATPQTVETGEKNDSLIVANFLKNRGKPEKSWKKPGQTDLKISHAHYLQTRANILRQKLKTLNQEKHPSEIKKLKVELDTILEKLSDEDFIQKLEKKVEQRRKRRLRVKKKKKAIYSMAQEQMGVMKSKNEFIESWLKVEKAKHETQLRDKEMQAQLDEALTEVRKKQQTLMKFKEKITVLSKLRKIRLEKLKTTGKDLPTESVTSHFDGIIAHTRDKLDVETAAVNSKADALKMFVETEQNNVRAALLKKKRLKEQKKRTLWEKERKEHLFGEYEKDIDAFEPMWPVHQLHKQAEVDISALVQYRCQWDQFLHAEGSEIPLGWVEPVQSPSAQWKIYAAENRNPKSTR